MSSKYPMSTSTDKTTPEYTDRIAKLGSSPKGEGHDNFLNGILVAFDLTLSNKAWVEAERYHFLDFISSQSTMHRIQKFDIGFGGVATIKYHTMSKQDTVAPGLRVHLHQQGFV